MNDIFSLQDRVAIITGASGSLAGSVALHLAKNGVKLALLTRKPANLKNLVGAIAHDGGSAKAFQADILSESSLREVLQEIDSSFGRADILLNSAGGNLPGAVIAPDQNIFSMSFPDFQEVVNLNLHGTVLPSMVFGEYMARTGRGCIVNYSSMAVDRVITRVAGYSASKAAMENFTKWMAVDMARNFGDAIRVNAIAPGFFIGKQNQRLLINEDGSLTPRGDAILRNTPYGRFGKPEELNGAIHFLCSDAASFISGAVLPIDGGFSAFSGV